MDEIIKMVAQKCGIPEATARSAVEVVIGQLKTKLPAPIAQQLDAVLAGSTGGSVLGDAEKGLGDSLGGLFGKK